MWRYNPMTDALICGDIHLSGKNPPNRIDDVVTDLQFNKIEEIVDIANTADVPIICTGDSFHTPTVSNKILSRFGRIINNLKREFYFVFGNHDMKYHDMAQVDNTSIGVVWANNCKIRHIFEFSKHYDYIPWSYINYGEPITKFPDSKRLLSHKAIVNDNLVNTESWIADDVNFCQPVSDFEDKFNLIICGHWHKPYIYKQKQTLVINPGPVIRRQITEREMPRVVYIDLDTLKYEEVFLLTAKPTEEVLREGSIKDELKPIEDRILSFIHNIKIKKQIKDGMNFIESLNSLLKSDDLDPDIKAELNDIMAVIAEKRGDNLNVDGE
jgi:DNA repair exonuclease SbcCD nuclease subunit